MTHRYARQRVALSDLGYGFLLTTFAVGRLLGTVLAPRLQGLSELAGRGRVRSWLRTVMASHAPKTMTRQLALTSN